MFFGISLSASKVEVIKVDFVITKIQISNCLADDLFVTNKYLEPSISYDTTWDYDTQMHAKYEGHPNAGNVNFAAHSVDFLRLKRRKAGTYKWLNLHEVNIGGSMDFHFEYFDRLCRAKQFYDYALVCVIGGIESNFIVNTIMSDFDDAFIVEKDKSYPLALNLSLSESPDKETTTVKTLGRKYPFIINNSIGYYTTGSLRGTFIQKDPVDCWTDTNIEQGWKYRDEVNTYLLNGLPKLIKYYDGRIFLANIDSVNVDYSRHELMPIHTIDFTEIGNSEEVGDLYDCGMIDCDLQRTTFTY